MSRYYVCCLITVALNSSPNCFFQNFEFLAVYHLNFVTQPSFFSLFGAKKPVSFLSFTLYRNQTWCGYNARFDCLGKEMPSTSFLAVSQFPDARPSLGQRRVDKWTRVMYIGKIQKHDKRNKSQAPICLVCSCGRYNSLLQHLWQWGSRKREHRPVYVSVWIRRSSERGCCRSDVIPSSTPKPLMWRSKSRKTQWSPWVSQVFVLLRR